VNASVDRRRIHSALQKVTSQLLAELGDHDHWTGELSSSALSTAVATIALGKMSEPQFVEPGLRWLAQNVNADGGWGDTIKSRSNLSTTALAWAAYGAANSDSRFSAVVQRAEQWLSRAAGSKETLPAAIAECYGKDRTFSVPILMTLALSGRLGPNGWKRVPALPFELAALPRGWFGALQLPVVSYALPALIAIGQTIHHHAPPRNPVTRFLRRSTRQRTLGILAEIQPGNGGFLEATPLTAFVTMSLAGMGQHSHTVAQRGAAFLRASMRPDGSWPIDTNLATWTTTLSVKALASQPEALSAAQRCSIRAWLLGQQFKSQHLYTGAAPGGWAWTNLPGGVPDADDTAGALLSLRLLDPTGRDCLRAAESGIEWLLNLQNRDGGVPTFCRGWGALPFDRSTPELTAHAMRAWMAWRKIIHPNLGRRVDRAMQRGLRYLEKCQAPDGSWVPLWFGNEHAQNSENPVYGTAQTLIALGEIADGNPVAQRLQQRAADYLTRAQLPSGGWGGDQSGPESIEETALAIEALTLSIPNPDSVRRGLLLLLTAIEESISPAPAPIGLYFARLWYFERLYPMIFAVGALGKSAALSVER
jgi:squalene-hopene/tetraprenyl-beta-curcumene cyclase